MKKALLAQRISSFLSTLMTQICMPLLLICAFTAQVNAQVPKINIQRTLKTFRFLSLLFLLLALAGSLQAQILSLQGVLRNSDGTALADGAYDLTFKLWDAEAGGNLIYTEQQKAPASAVQVTGGIYSTYLGKVGPITAPFDKPYWLGVTIGAGIEMVPRAQLGSSPYTLAIRGTENLFPSSGTVGIGFAPPNAPNSSFKLDVNGNVNVAGNQTVAGTATVASSVVTGNQTVNGTATSASSVVTGNQTVNGTATSASSVVTGNQSVYGVSYVTTSEVTQNQTVFGSQTVNGTVTIAGFTSRSLPPIWYFYDLNNGSGGATWWANPSTQNISLTTTHYIDSRGIVARSDRRIKKDICNANAKEDLSLLQKLHVTDYRYIDEVKKGNDFTKGFIAQEVKQVFPQAVIQTADFIPDVYAQATGILCSEGKMTLSLGKNHGFVVGDEVKLMLVDGERTATVAATPSEQSFSVEWAEPALDKVFVYGKKVEDLNAVDYDRIFTLNVSATQELARRQGLIETENAALKDEIAGLKAEIAGLYARQDASAQVLEAFAMRLKRLEANNIPISDSK